MQIALVQHLKVRARAGVMWWHTPNGELRDKRAAAKLKAMGVLPGVADLIFVWRGPAAPHLLFLELKTERGSLSADQVAFGDAVQRIGAYYHVAWSLDDALSILKTFDLIR